MIAGPLPDAPWFDLEVLDVWQMSAWTFIDAWLPDLPGVIGRAPGGIEVLARNLAEGNVDGRVVIAFERLDPFTMLATGGATPAHETSNADAVLELDVGALARGEVFDARTSSIVTDADGVRREVLPLIGLVRVTATAIAEDGEAVLSTDTMTMTVIVFPWSEALALLVLLVTYLLGRRNGRRGRRRLGASPAHTGPGGSEEAR